MGQTPTNGGNDREQATKSRGAYLPVLPDGWVYQVRLSGPDGTVTVKPHGPDAAGGYDVDVHPGGGMETRSLRKSSLGDGVRAAAASVKALTKMTKHQAEADAARSALLDEIGGDPETADPKDTAAPKAEAAKADVPQPRNENSSTAR